MENELTEKKQNLTIPGLGVSGLVLCPFGFQKTQCVKQACELWTELETDVNGEKIKVGRCAISWMPILSIENRLAIEKNIRVNTGDNK